jgi:hypothetical protein
VDARRSLDVTSTVASANAKLRRPIGPFYVR